MNDTRIVIVHDAADSDYAVRLGEALERGLAARLEDAERPGIERREGIAGFPNIDAIGPLSLVFLVLPGRDLTDAERAPIDAFLARAAGDTRILPISGQPGRYLPPEPLAARVSAPVHDPDDPETIGRLITWTLIQLCLSLSSARRSVFLSYKIADGKSAAARLERMLVARGFNVFRDEMRDRDDLKKLEWGSDAQKTLYREIASHGLVLLVDTPKAKEASRWIDEEIQAALGLMLPIFPVVIAGPGESEENLPLGGRFEALKAQQADIRCGPEALDEATVESAIDDAFLDRLEAALAKHLRRHYAVQRTILRSTRAHFQRLKFEFQDVEGGRYMIASRVRENAKAPGLCVRLLVQCSPYRAVLPESVDTIRKLIREHGEHCQYGILIEPAAAHRFPTTRSRMLEKCGGHLLILEPDEIGPVAAHVFRMEDPS